MPMSSMIGPHLYHSSVHAIDLDALWDDGVRVLLLDLDNTLLPRDTNVVPDELRQWTEDLKTRGFRVCLLSNNFHERVRRVAADLGLDLVDHAVKPLPFAFLRALARVGGRASEAAMVGDQLFTDILGGRLLGMRTVLVSPLSATDLPHTLLLRRLEALVLKGRTPKS
jgi:HAD superfamily phosphatase (TIGR01668 family)